MNPRFKKKEHTCTSDRAKRLRKHILEGLSQVLKRPRFGIEVGSPSLDDHPHTGLHFSHAEYKYFLQVSVVDLVVLIEVMSQEDGLYYHSVYSDSFPVRQIISVNKMGTTIANKIRNRTVMNIMAE